MVILNYNVRYFLELCLKSVEAALTNIDSEIIVVDNNSSDDSCTMIKNNFPNVILIENEENTGFSKGNNIGVNKAIGKYVCILNPDTVVAEDTFVNLLKIGEEQEKLGILGCQLIDGSGNYLPESKRNIPSPSIALKKLLGKSKLYYANNLNPNDSGKVEILVGAFMLINRDVYNLVNGFDEDYFMYGEDIDLSYRILKKGYTNYYAGSETVIHFKGESTLRDKLYAKRFYNAMNIFYRKHFKSNVFFDFIVKVGTFVMRIIQPFQKQKKEISNTRTEVLLDNNILSFKEIIKTIKEGAGNYKIKPNNSNFVISSNHSETRGNITILD